MARALSALRPSGLVLLAAALTACSSHDDTKVPAQVDSGFDFVHEAYSFENFAENAQGYALTPDSVARMFGAELVCENKKLPCRPTSLATAWIEGVNQTLYEGRSEGFAVSALLFSLGHLKPSDFGAETVAELRIQSNPKLQAELAYWAATQAVPSAVKDDLRFSAKEVMRFLAKALDPEEKERYRLAIAQKTKTGLLRGHALVPIGYYRASEEGQYVLRVYDCNFPQRERLLAIDTHANTWRYEVPLVDGETLVYEGTPENGNLLYFSPVTTRLAKLELPFGKDSSTSTLASVGRVDLTAAAGDASSAGFQNGEVVEKGDGRVVPAFSNCPLCNAPKGILNYTLPAKQKEPVSVLVSAGVGMEATDGKGAQVNFAGPNYTSSVKGIKGKSSQTDQITVDPKNGAITYKSESDSQVEISTSIKSDKGATTTVTVKVSGSSSAVTVGLDEKGRPVVQHAGVSEGTSITVSVKTVADDGMVTTKEVVYQAGDMDAEVRIDPMSGEVSTMNIRGVEQGSCYNGVLEPDYERDVDCGGSCTARCALGQHCEVDADCTGEAKCLASAGVAKTCRMEGCSDKIKNGQETDVDCGGSTCKPCVSTAFAEKLCKQNSDCDQGGLCVENTQTFSNMPYTWKGCQLKQPVRVRVRGGRPSTQLVFATTADGASMQRTLNIDSADQTALLLTAYAYDVSIAQQPASSNCVIDAGEPPLTWPAKGTTGVSDYFEPAERLLSITCTPTDGALSVAVTGLPAGGRIGLTRTFDTASSVSIEQTGTIPLGSYLGSWTLAIASQPGLVNPTDFSSYTLCSFGGKSTAQGTLAVGDEKVVALTCAKATCPADVCNTKGNVSVSVSGLPAGATLGLDSTLAGTKTSRQLTQNATTLLGNIDGSYQLQITTADGVYPVTGGTAHLSCNFASGGKTTSGTVNYQKPVTASIVCVANMCPHALCPPDTGTLKLAVSNLPGGGKLSFNTNLAGKASTVEVLQNGTSTLGAFAGSYQIDLTTAAGIYAVTGGEVYMSCAFAGDKQSASGTLKAGDDVTLQVSCTQAACPSVACNQPCTQDGDCVSGSCYCGASSGQCDGNSGQCTPLRAVFATPVSASSTPSGTFTVPANCSEVYVQAWGAAGAPGMANNFPNKTYNWGGAGGYVGGKLSVTQGEVISVWVGQGGEIAGTTVSAGGTPGIGSYFGSAANGGLGHGDTFTGAGGGGGGLTSVRVASDDARSFVVPGGGGGSLNNPGGDVGGDGAGTESGSSGASAAADTFGGGGGAGYTGGAGATQYDTAGLAGAYGPLPASMTTQNGASGTPANTDFNDYYNLCVNAAMAMGTQKPGDGTRGFGDAEYGGNGCVTIRCVEGP